ncbi:MAG: hypothetical protein HeimC3_21240 [Candidatus Heimdallarchaeota archaeon LC_3]|nr:MAG: hypothetical protein HeimC3_21240 [Candidatus Heimdallarchaeota archaeon LC_3]
MNKTWEFMNNPKKFIENFPSFIELQNKKTFLKMINEINKPNIDLKDQTIQIIAIILEFNNKKYFFIKSDFAGDIQ